MSRIITLLTDFGSRDPYVGIMKGVIFSRSPTARIVDLTHEIAAQDVVAGGFALQSAVGVFPDGTIHLAVVDPGVGTARRSIIVETATGVLVGPDNGVLAPAANLMGKRTIRLIENKELFREPVSMTFHGRDVFAPVAAALAEGMDPSQVGRCIPTMHPAAIPEPVLHGRIIRGEVIHIDHFGNLVINVERSQASDAIWSRCKIGVADRIIYGVLPTYGAASAGETLALFGSSGHLEIAVCGGDAAVLLGIVRGDAVAIEIA